MNRKNLPISQLSGFERLSIREQQMLKGGGWWSEFTGWLVPALEGLFQDLFGGSSNSQTMTNGNGNYQIQQSGDGNEVTINGQIAWRKGQVTQWGVDSMKAMSSGDYMIYGADSLKIQW
jgi:hypothetical protein